MSASFREEAMQAITLGRIDVHVAHIDGHYLRPLSVAEDANAGGVDVDQGAVEIRDDDGYGHRVE